MAKDLPEECIPGQWTKSMTNAIEVGKKNKRFIFVDYTKSNGCGYCNNAWSAIYSKSSFLNWSKNNGIPILYADILDSTNTYQGSSLESWIWDNYFSDMKSIALPYALLLDPNSGSKNKPKCLMRMLIQGALGHYTNSGYNAVKQVLAANMKGCPNLWFMDFNTSGLVSDLQYLFSQVPQKLENALEISESDKVGQFGDYGVRTLGCHNYWSHNTLIPRIALKSYSSSQFHWFKFKGVAGKSYRITISDYVDSENCGKCLVFYDKDKAVNATTYSRALDYCSASFSMSDTIQFQQQSDDYTYILFTRKDDIQEEFQNTKGETYTGYHEFDLTYTFMITQSDVQLYGVTFFDEDGTVLKPVQYVESGKNAVPPDDPSKKNCIFTGWKPDYRNVKSDLSCYANYSQFRYENPRTVSEVNRDTTLFAYT